MGKTFKITGITIMILAIFELFYVASSNLFIGLIASMITFILGMALIAIDGLLVRVRYLENHLNVSFEGANAKDTTLPQIECPNCGNKHDFDDPRCPNCKRKNEKY